MKHSIGIWASVLLAAVLSACSSQLVTPTDAAVADGSSQVAGDSCPAGREPIYGWAFDSPTTCINFGVQTNRIQIACLPVERLMSGLVTCYVQTGGSVHVMTPWRYEGLQSHGWEVCQPDEAARLNCP